MWKLGTPEATFHSDEISYELFSVELTELNRMRRFEVRHHDVGCGAGHRSQGVVSRGLRLGFDHWFYKMKKLGRVEFCHDQRWRSKKYRQSRDNEFLRGKLCWYRR